MAEVTTTSRWGVHPWVAEQANRVRFGIATHPRAEWSVLRGFVRDVEALGSTRFGSRIIQCGVPTAS